MNKKTVIYILGCVLVFVSAFMLLPWFVSLIYSEETGKYFLYTAIAGFVLGRIMTWKKPEKGGRGNVLFVVAAIEAPPAELLGAADEVSVLFPWGSLLAGVARAEHETLANIRTLCQGNMLYFPGCFPCKHIHHNRMIR